MLSSVIHYSAMLLSLLDVANERSTASSATTFSSFCCRWSRVDINRNTTGRQCLALAASCLSLWVSDYEYFATVFLLNCFGISDETVK